MSEDKKIIIFAIGLYLFLVIIFPILNLIFYNQLMLGQLVSIKVIIISAILDAIGLTIGIGIILKGRLIEISTYSLLNIPLFVLFYLLGTGLISYFARLFIDIANFIA